MCRQLWDGVPSPESDTDVERFGVVSSCSRVCVSKTWNVRDRVVADVVHLRLRITFAEIQNLAPQRWAADEPRCCSRTSDELVWTFCGWREQRGVEAIVAAELLVRWPILLLTLPVTSRIQETTFEEEVAYLEQYQLCWHRAHFFSAERSATTVRHPAQAGWTSFLGSWLNWEGWQSP